MKIDINTDNRIKKRKADILVWKIVSIALMGAIGYIFGSIAQYLIGG